MAYKVGRPVPDRAARAVLIRSFLDPDISLDDPPPHISVGVAVMINVSDLRNCTRSGDIRATQAVRTAVDPAAAGIIGRVHVERATEVNEMQLVVAIPLPRVEPPVGVPILTRIEDSVLVCILRRIELTTTVVIARLPVVKQTVTGDVIAKSFGVSRSWVYANADALGALRIGRGQNGRIRFDPRLVRERIQSIGSPSPSPGRRRSKRARRSDGADLLAIRERPHAGRG